MSRYTPGDRPTIDPYRRLAAAILHMTVQDALRYTDKLGRVPGLAVMQQARWCLVHSESIRICCELTGIEHEVLVEWLGAEAWEDCHHTPASEVGVNGHPQPEVQRETERA